MSDLLKGLLGSAAILAVGVYAGLATITPRYAIVSGGGTGPSVYRLDRQTGAMAACFATTCQPIDGMAPQSIAAPNGK